MILREQSVHIHPPSSDDEIVAALRDAKRIGRVRADGRSPQHVAGERAQTTIEDVNQLVRVGVEQPATLFEMHSCVIEQRVVQHS